MGQLGKRKQRSLNQILSGLAESEDCSANSCLSHAGVRASPSPTAGNAAQHLRDAGVQWIHQAALVGDARASLGSAGSGSPSISRQHSCPDELCSPRESGSDYVQSEEETDDCSGDESFDVQPKRRGRPAAGHSKQFAAAAVAIAPTVHSPAPQQSQPMLPEDMLAQATRARELAAAAARHAAEMVARARNIAMRSSAEPSSKRQRTSPSPQSSAGAQVDQVPRRAPRRTPAAVTGARVAVWWAEDRMWFRGTVTKVDQKQGRHRIQYDDGLREWLPLHRHRFRWLGPRGRSSGYKASCKAEMLLLAAQGTAAHSICQGAAPAKPCPSPASSDASALKGTAALGWRLLLHFEGDDRWYPATVVGMGHKGQHVLLYDDGEHDTVTLARERVQWVGPALAPVQAGLPADMIPPVGRAAVGWRISVHCNSQRAFCAGLVVEFDPLTGMHSVAYGEPARETEWMTLSQQQVTWQIPPPEQCPASGYVPSCTAMCEVDAQRAAAAVQRTRQAGHSCLQAAPAAAVGPMPGSPVAGGMDGVFGSMHTQAAIAPTPPKREPLDDATGLSQTHFQEWGCSAAFEGQSDDAAAVLQELYRINLMLAKVDATHESMTRKAPVSVFDIHPDLCGSSGLEFGQDFAQDHFVPTPGGTGVCSLDPLGSPASNPFASGGFCFPSTDGSAGVPGVSCLSRAASVPGVAAVACASTAAVATSPLARSQSASAGTYPLRGGAALLPVKLEAAVPAGGLAQHSGARGAPSRLRLGSRASRALFPGAELDGALKMETDSPHSGHSAATVARSDTAFTLLSVDFQHLAPVCGILPTGAPQGFPEIPMSPELCPSDFVEGFLTDPPADCLRTGVVQSDTSPSIMLVAA